MEVVEFTPEVKFTHDEQAQIAHTLQTPGFKHINRIMRAEVSKFVIDLINVEEHDEKQVVAKHRLSKAAAWFYQRVVNRMNEEVQQFAHEVSVPSSPVDPTEGMLDLGNFARPNDPDEKTEEEFLNNLELNEKLLEEELNSE